MFVGAELLHFFDISICCRCRQFGIFIDRLGVRMWVGCNGVSFDYTARRQYHMGDGISIRWSYAAICWQLAMALFGCVDSRSAHNSLLLVIDHLEISLKIYSFYRLIPESLHWMITHKKSRAISQYIYRSTKINRKSVPLEECQAIDVEIKSEAAKRSVRDIFKSFPFVFQLIIHCFIM